MEALEWEQLRVEGKPLLNGAAFGATPLLWVACRAQPCMIHLFCDTQLQDIWSFPADPVFLLIGQGKDQAHLLVITRDGCIWILPLSKPKTSASRPAKKRKTQKVGEIQRIQPRPTNLELDFVGASNQQTTWKKLAVESYRLRASEVKNVVVADSLLGTVPGATVAAFGPNNHVAVGSPIGTPELLNLSSLTGSEFRTSIPGLRRGTTCLLVVSSMRHRQKHGDQTYVSQDLFKTLSSPSAGASDPESLLIQGGMDGKVCTFHMQKETLVAPPHFVCDLQQPVATIIPVAKPATQEANWLLVVGLLGKVAFLSSGKDRPISEEPNDSPFLTHTTVKNKCIMKKLEGAISGPITSACLVGGARLCYIVDSAIFVTELFESEDSQKLPSQRISVSNVAAITGPGLFTYNGSHSLVALTGAGRLFSIKTSKQVASPGVDSYSGRSVKVSLQSIADAETCRDAIQSHEQALTLAMNELALALPRAREIATEKEELTSVNAKLGCTLTATPVPSTSVGGHHLSFGGLRKPATSVDKNMYKSFKTRLDIVLTNQSKAPLSQYWSLVLELQSGLSTATPTSQYSFTINNGHGLPVGCQWNHRIHVYLPGGPWGPVMATVYLCHIHDSHKALLQNPKDSPSSAACVVLLRQQIDLFSLLQGPQSTLGHTPWTPAINSLKKSVSSFAVAGLDEIAMLDETLGSFSGELTWSAKQNVGRSVDGASDWQTGFLRHLLQQPFTSAEWKRLRLTAQGGGTVSMSIDGRGELQSVVKVQTSCLLLGILLREALLRQLDAGGDGKNFKLHRKESTHFVSTLDEVQSLAQRAREALNLWTKFRSHFAATPAHDLVAPLLGHTYVVTAQLIQAYRRCREVS